jgi:3'-phosphoadenosine 5'-phosphosulfate sulfotransferase (PAPS reductase)/FAD synthetase
MPTHIALISHGKDSLAMLEAIKLQNLPLDRIITVDVWATPTIRGEYPEMVEFKNKADDIILKKYGIEVEHLRADKSFEEQFYSVIQSGGHKGSIYGFPQTVRAWCNDRLKMKPLEVFRSKDTIRYLGIAYDETERIERQKGKDNVVLPLVLAGWTEADAYQYCSDNNLLSPSYSKQIRDGCWFCPKQPLGSLRRLRSDYPDLWQLLLKWDSDSPIPFDASGFKVKDFDYRFQCEDEGLLPRDKAFRWAMLDSLQMRWNL